MSEGHGRTSLLGRRGFLAGGIALSTCAVISSTYREASGKTCSGLTGKLDRLTEAADMGSGSAGFANVGLLAKLIMITNNSDYVDTASTQPAIYVSKSLDVTTFQGDGANPSCTFRGATKNLVKAIRIPYYGMAAKGARCVAEHILIGYEVLGLPLPPTNFLPWSPPQANKTLDDLGNAIVVALSTTDPSPGPSVAPNNWDGVGSRQRDSAPGDWRFRGLPIRADVTDRYNYGVFNPILGANSYAYLYVGYEGGGAY